MIKGYVGIPFIDGGRNRLGCDCGGLVRLVYQDRGIELPEYLDIGADDLLAIAKMIKKETAPNSVFQMIPDISQAREMDVIIMQSREMSRIAVHIGIVASPRKMLHVEAMTNSVMVDFNHPSIANRMLAAYRHKDFRK